MSVQDPSQGQFVDGYEVLRCLGGGGMARTWLCRLHGHRGFSRLVVLKTLREALLDDRAYHTMFLDEARIGALLEHPNIPRVERLSTFQGVPYMVQEYVEGPRFTEVMKAMVRRGALDVALSCRLVQDVARALHYVHHVDDELGQPLHLVHRDVSTSNIIVSIRGKAKLIDFGVAIFEEREVLTETGLWRGKPQYMAPECAAPDRPLTPAMDVFSLGVVLYVGVAGQFPWRQHAPLALLDGNFPQPIQLNPLISDELNALLMGMLAPDERERPTAEEVVASLGQLQEGVAAMTDDIVVQRVKELFPNGPKDWAVQPQGESAPPRIFGRRLAGAGRAPSPSRAGPPWLVFSLVATFLAMTVTLVFAGMLWSRLLL